MQVKIEVGYQPICRENLAPTSYTHDGTIFVHGTDGADISHFVKKVVFLLHGSFLRPKIGNLHAAGLQNISNSFKHWFVFGYLQSRTCF